MSDRDEFGGAETSGERAAKAAFEYLDFMETAPEHVLRGVAPVDPSLPRYPSDTENAAWRAFVLAKTLNSDRPADSVPKLKLERAVEHVPALAVVRSIYHARFRRLDSYDSPENFGHIRQRKGFDTFLLAQVFCEDQKLQDTLPYLDPELFVPHLREAMDMSNQHITRAADRMATLKSMDVPVQALALGIRSELYNDMRYVDETPMPKDPRKWPPELQDELIQYQEGSDTAAFMTNACLRAIRASRT